MSRGHQITQIIIDGVAQGTLTGSISFPGIDFTLSPTVTNSDGGNVYIDGDSDVSALSSLGQAFVTGAQSALEHATSHAVENLLSGIFGTNSATGQNNVALKLDASIHLAGMLLQKFLVDSVALAVPGYDQTNTVGFAPAYNEPLGVFYISQRPMIQETVYITPQTDANGAQIPAQRQYIYTVDPASFQVIVNPSVLSRASVLGFHSEVVVHDSNGEYPISGQRENVGGQFYYTGDIVETDGAMAFIRGVRISFQVIPNDGSPAVTVVKTFVANKTTTEIVTGPGEDQS